MDPWFHSDAPKRRMTYAEFSELPEQRGLQLIDAWLVCEPSASTEHQDCALALGGELRAYVRRHKLGRVFAALDVVLAEDQVLQPDVMFVRSERLSIIQHQGLTASPDLSVEILSPSTRRYDLGRKRELYLRYGCAELWIIDLQDRALLQHLPGRSGWKMARLSWNDVVIATAVPGFRLKLAELMDSE